MLSNTIDLWLADCQREDIDRCRLILNDAELRRAEQFKTELLQQRFIAARAMLKRILANYQDIKAEYIVFDVGEFGKPFLSGQHEDEGLVFNISHTANKLAVVIGFDQKLGVDIERHKPINSLPGLVKKCFAESESQYWQGLSEADKISLFFDIWTRKESFVKAVGRGIALGLDQCETSIKKPEQFVSIPVFCGLVRDWKAISINMPEGYSGAISTNNVNSRVNVFNGSGY